MVCQREGRVLSPRRLDKFYDFAAFEAFLAEDGPWVAAFDFPFGLPLALLEALGWPESWENYVRQIAAMAKADYEGALLAYQNSRPYGEKLLYRLTDRITRSSSPMKLHYPPVGKMFFQGAPRLLACGVSVLPCRPTSSGKIALEGYPALLARRFSGGSYKSESRGQKDGERAQARRNILNGVCDAEKMSEFGLSVRLEDVSAERLLDDASGDSLDALLCAIQAAWAYSREDFGIPAGCNRNEGWIIDPVYLDVFSKD